MSIKHKSFKRFTVIEYFLTFFINSYTCCTLYSTYCTNYTFYFLCSAHYAECSSYCTCFFFKLIPYRLFCSKHYFLFCFPQMFTLHLVIHFDSLKEYTRHLMWQPDYSFIKVMSNWERWYISLLHTDHKHLDVKSLSEGILKNVNVIDESYHKKSSLLCQWRREVGANLTSMNTSRLRPYASVVSPDHRVRLRRPKKGHQHHVQSHHPEAAPAHGS